MGLKPRDIKVDLFASEANAQAGLYCTEENSAWQYSWTKLSESCKGFLWANPPFGDLEYVVEKLRREPVKMLLLVPRWPSKPWWKPLQDIAESHVVLPKDTTIYIPGKGLPLRPRPQWDSVLFKIDTTGKHKEGKRDTTPRGLGIERWVWCDFKGWGLEVLRDHVALARPQDIAVRLAVGRDLAEKLRMQGGTVTAQHRQ